MPYEGEYAQYQPLKRIVESARVQQLLRRSRILDRSTLAQRVTPRPPPRPNTVMPSLILAIDGSYAEVDVRNGYPGAKVGYCSVASVIMNLAEVERLDAFRPINPVNFRKTEDPSSDAAALPGCNVITRDHISACDSFREAVFDLLYDAIVDEEDETQLLATYQALLAYKPTEEIACPYAHLGCTRNVSIGANVATCPCERRKPLFPTDAMRIHERFNDDSGSNGEAFGCLMQVWERLLLVHLLRCFEQREWLTRLSEVAFFLDGPLAIFGPPAWLSAAIAKELQRINGMVRAQTGNDLLLIGIEKSGTFVTHFEEVDKREDGGQHFEPGTYFMPNDSYIKERIIYSNSAKRYGADTYFGRKFFYKTRSGARIVATIPFLTALQDTLATDEPSAFSQFGTVCSLLDKLVTSRFANALAPLVSAHARSSDPSSSWPKGAKTAGSSADARVCAMIPTAGSSGKYTTAAGRWAGVGPYYAMFPAAFASQVVREHTEEGDLVLDPFAGRGTAVFAAASENRVGLGIEINPVGWVYGRAKLQTASRSSVEMRLKWLSVKAPRYRAEAAALPEFPVVFLSRGSRVSLAARDQLKWRRRKPDWTTMALLMVNLHGKRESALSNQLRQTKAMSPLYAVRWWKERGMKPRGTRPCRVHAEEDCMALRERTDPSKRKPGLPRRQSGAPRCGGESQRRPARQALFTSPPYHGVANYFYDSGCAFGSLAVRANPGVREKTVSGSLRTGASMWICSRQYSARSKPLLTRDATVYVQTDAQKFTLGATIEALERAFPEKRLRKEYRSRPNVTQTALFGSTISPEGEVDLLMW